ncbi:MBL fold metallo-hydrolase [Piscinibacter sp. HJYY11]|uniref:MBL fold metallo-hydrolase n=1 Tax=Piscinibacter sp. HJYY11 TaxID=2801333 RepID=UPI00191D3758|nr:MBL fold metallo-hydrolase [Piscinibacter sp. HJYY11]MBL0726576.1 MBL fold metallo-hydrolase [Piscinibacter sp. HJYY11]
MKLTFLGGTGTVTGSKYLLEHGGRHLMIDCGLFQGLKQLRLRNWEPLPIAPREIDAIVLTHAHLDHSGYIPRLDHAGFNGHVHCSAATRDLCGLLLPDSGRLLEEEAEYANRHGFSRHRPALPLYTEDNARAAMAAFRDVGFGAPFEPIPGVSVTLRRAGHLLGAASVHVAWKGGSILFSGDLGRQEDLLMAPPAPPVACDWLVVESTYGDRAHSATDALGALADIVSRTAARGGIVVIPAFAVGRAQALMYGLHLLRQQHRIPDIPVFLNSPMAADATRFYRQHRAEHRLDEAQCEAMYHAARIVNTVEESKRLNDLRVPSIIISASGMASGGRVLHHLKAFAPDGRNSIVFAGFQAAGTRGAAMVAAAESVKIHGQHIPVRAEVACLDSLSAHADRDELLRWAGALPARPRHVFVTHGEPVPADTLRQALEERHGFTCSVPEYRDVVDLDRR